MLFCNTCRTFLGHFWSVLIIKSYYCPNQMKYFCSSLGQDICCCCCCCADKISGWILVFAKDYNVKNISKVPCIIGTEIPAIPSRVSEWIESVCSGPNQTTSVLSDFRCRKLKLSDKSIFVCECHLKGWLGSYELTSKNNWIMSVLPIDILLLWLLLPNRKKYKWNQHRTLWNSTILMS